MRGNSLTGDNNSPSMAINIEIYAPFRHIRRIVKISSQIPDQALLLELGSRLSATRLAQNLTQAALAERAGVAKRTVERLESGAVATQLSGFLRVCRALGLLEGLDALVPEQAASPMAQLRLQGNKRQRASRAKVAAVKSKKWTWGDST